MTRPRTSIDGQIPPRGRVGGVDYGRRRIGVAVCDAERIIASPLDVRETSGDHAADAAFFQSLARTEDFVGFVVGLPLHADGAPSTMSKEAERFGAWLARATGLPVAFHDERYTSHEAAGMLAGVGLSRGMKKNMSDAVAAQVILRSWMDAQSAPAHQFQAVRQAQAVRLVVGCGYLGERVARRWRADGDRVIGTTRSSERARQLEAMSIEPAIIDVTAHDADWSALLSRAGHPSTVLWSVAVDRASSSSYRDVHVAGFMRLLDAINAMNGPKPRVIFSSSTGVWGDEQGGVVNEMTPVAPTREAGHVLVEAERMLSSHPAGPGTSLRFAGLYGPSRVPRLADLRAGRPIAADPESWLNLIHVNDAAAIVAAVANATSPKPLYVVSDGCPVRRREWYGRMAEIAGAPTPSWDAPASRARGGDKRVDPSLLVADLGVQLEHPTALSAIAEMLQEPVTD